MIAQAQSRGLGPRRTSSAPRLAGWIAALSIFATAASSAQSPSTPPLNFTFTEIGERAGLTAPTIYGGTATNKYLLETTGSGAAVLDYDADGWLDLFVVNGTTLEGFPKGNSPHSHLYRNKRDGTFEDVTKAAGLALTGWGQAACTADYDNDGRDDLFVTFYGSNRLFRNRGDGTFEETTTSAGLGSARTRWGAGCAFFDYDRDGQLDLFVANYIDLDLKTAPVPESGLCRYKGVPVACGPPGLPGGKNILYRNLGKGTFADVSEASGITRASGTYALGVSTLDFDDDGWVDVYVANDSNPSALYKNNRDGTFTDIGIAAGCAFSQDGKPQAGMGVAVGDYNRDGRMDIFKTNFAGDTSTLYVNSGSGLCDDRTFAAGIGRNTRWLGWGVAFLDLDHDGWSDLFLVNGHVYPEVEQLKTEAGYRQRKVVYRNRGDGRFDDVTEALGGPVMTPRAGRGAVFADLDNDGDVDVLVNNMHERPDLYRLDLRDPRTWITIRLVGVTSNRSAIGARLRVTAGGVTQVDEVRGGGSYYAQNDLRRNFGLNGAARVDRVEVRWPSGVSEVWEQLDVNRITTLTEGTGKTVAGTVSTVKTVLATVFDVENGPNAGDDATEILQETVPAPVSEARRLINAGRPKDALLVLAKVTDGDDARAALLRGVAHFHADDPLNAIAALTPLVDRLAADSIERREADQVLGLALVAAGRFADAVPRLEATRRWAGDNLELAYALAQAYIQTQRAADARAALASIYRVPADSAAAHLLAAQTMIRLEMEPLAEGELRKALEIDPRLPHVHQLLGQIALFRGRLDEASELTRRELDLNPANGVAWSQLGDACVRQGKWDEAIAALQKSVWINPYYSAPYILLGRAYAKKDQPSGAEGMYRRAIQLDPNNRTAHYALAQLLQQTGRADEATREFAIAEKLRDPRNR